MNPGTQPDEQEAMTMERTDDAPVAVDERPGITRMTRHITTRGKRDGEDVTISLPAAPFEIPVADRSETAPRGPLIRVDGRDGAWLTRRAVSRWA